MLQYKKYLKLNVYSTRHRDRYLIFGTFFVREEKQSLFWEITRILEGEMFWN